MAKMVILITGHPLSRFTTVSVFALHNVLLSETENWYIKLATTIAQSLSANETLKHKNLPKRPLVKLNLAWSILGAFFCSDVAFDQKNCAKVRANF